MQKSVLWPLFERWAPSDSAEPHSRKVPYRLQLCGHVVFSELGKVDEIRCPVCEQPAGVDSDAGFGKLKPFRDFVPTPDLRWSGFVKTGSRRLKLKHGVMRSANVASVEDFTVALSIPCAQGLRLRQEALKSQYSPIKQGHSFLAWRVGTLGAHVSGGCIQFPVAGVLLLAGRGASFNGTRFSGGIVVCTGDDFSGSFQQCTFERTPVYVVHGASVTLHRCAFRDAKQQPALCASGRHACATVSESTFSHCCTTIVADDGGTVRAIDTHISAMTSGVVVNGRGSRACMQGCDVRGAPSGYVRQFGMHAMHACEASASLRRCTLRNFLRGVKAVSGATVEAHDVIEDDMHEGVVAQMGGVVLVRGVGLRSALDGPGVPAGCAKAFCATSGRAFMHLERCTVPASSRMQSLDVCENAALSASLCSFSCLPKSAMVADVSGSAVLSHCNAEGSDCALVLRRGGLKLVGGCYGGSKYACNAKGGGKFTAVDCELRTSHCTGSVAVFVEHGANACLHSCLVHYAEAGVHAHGASVAATDVQFSDFYPLSETTQGTSILGYACACDVGTLALRGGSVSRCLAGAHVIAQADGALEAVSATVEGVSFNDCLSGVVFSSGVASVNDCTFHCVREDDARLPPSFVKAIHARKRCVTPVAVSALGERAVIEHSAMHGYDIGVLTDGGKSCMLRHCEVRSVRSCVQASKATTLEDCTLTVIDAGPVPSYAMIHGIGVWPGATCMVRRCRFSGACAAAVNTQGPSTTSLEHITIDARCTTGVRLFDGPTVLLQDCEITDAESAIAMDPTGGHLTAERVIMRASAASLLVSGDYGKAIVPCTASLTDCKLYGGSGAAVIVDGLPANLTISGCELLATATGYKYGMRLRGKVHAKVERTRVANFETGISAHFDLGDQKRVCTVCGRLPWEQIQVMGNVMTSPNFAKPQHEGRCVHEGAVTRLRIADTVLEDCSKDALCAGLFTIVSAERVTARRCGRGFHVKAVSLESSTFEECRAVDCQEASAREHFLTILMGVPMAEPIPEIEGEDCSRGPRIMLPN